MAKKRYKIDYITRGKNASLTDLLKHHQEVFPNNTLATWRAGNKIIVKVSNYNRVTGKTLAESKSAAGYVEPVRRVNP